MKLLFNYLVVLSSVVIVLSLALAFNEQARQWLFWAFRSSVNLLVRPVMNRNKNDTSNLASAPPRVIREYIISRQKEWDGGDGANSTSSLPLHRNEEPRRTITARLTNMWKHN